MTLIIFDYNRTIYDPENRRLFPYTRPALEKLRKQGHTLILVSKKEAQRENTLRSLGIISVFSKTIFTKTKDKTLFEKIQRRFGRKSEKIFVVGDRVRGEIKIGNKLKMKTIWIRQGKFRDEMPRSRAEIPYITIHSIRELKKFIE